jgi:Tfp pilus assembly protein PilN
MKILGPNLAARPFANERPVKRTTLLVWIAALILLAINAFLYQRHLSAHYEQRQAIRDLQDQIESEKRAVRQGEADLAALDLHQQNQRVLFLNGQIARRTFSWSRLFDRLEEVLPAKVELQRVSPKIVEEQRRSGRSRITDIKALVTIELRGEANSDEELLELVDNLFNHPSFTLPDLQRESQKGDGLLEFNLNVLYLPSRSEPVLEAVPPATTVEEASLPKEPAGGDR